MLRCMRTLATVPGRSARSGLFVASACFPALCLTGTHALAQDAPSEGDGQMTEVIVIGTPGGGGVDRQEASFAVTTIQQDEISRLAPQSTAELMKSIPGVWVESSGGVAGANIDVRGLPGGGDAPFVTLAINGSPLYGTENAVVLRAERHLSHR